MKINFSGPITFMHLQKNRELSGVETRATFSKAGLLESKRVRKKYLYKKIFQLEKIHWKRNDDIWTWIWELPGWYWMRLMLNVITRITEYHPLSLSHWNVHGYWFALGWTLMSFQLYSTRTSVIDHFWALSDFCILHIPTL